GRAPAVGACARSAARTPGGPGRRRGRGAARTETLPLLPWWRPSSRPPPRPPDAPSVPALPPRARPPPTLPHIPPPAPGRTPGGIWPPVGQRDPPPRAPLG